MGKRQGAWWSDAPWWAPRKLARPAYLRAPHAASAAAGASLAAPAMAGRGGRDALFEGARGRVRPVDSLPRHPRPFARAQRQRRSRARRTAGERRCVPEGAVAAHTGGRERRADAGAAAEGGGAETRACCHTCHAARLGLCAAARGRHELAPAPGRSAVRPRGLAQATIRIGDEVREQNKVLNDMVGARRFAFVMCRRRLRAGACAAVH